jgi:hypothetical protein
VPKLSSFSVKADIEKGKGEIVDKGGALPSYALEDQGVRV